jgi:hypothetical protein
MTTDHLKRLLNWSTFIVISLYFTYIIHGLASNICFAYYGRAGSGPYSRCSFLPEWWLDLIMRFEIVPVLISLIAAVLILIVLKLILKPFKNWYIHFSHIIMANFFLYFLFLYRCMIKFDSIGNPYSTCSLFSFQQIIFFNNHLIFSYIFFLILGFFFYIVVYSIYRISNMDYKKLGKNIFLIFNVSLALFFVLWQLIVKVCGSWTPGGKSGDVLISKCHFVPTSLMFDSFVIITFYLIVLSLVVFFFLLASQHMYERIKQIQPVLVLTNILFIFILFFEF